MTVKLWCPDDGGMVRAYRAEGMYAPLDPEYSKESTFVAKSDYDQLEKALEIIQFELSPGQDAARSLAARVRVARRTLDRVLGSTPSGEVKQ